MIERTATAPRALGGVRRTRRPSGPLVLGLLLWDVALPFFVFPLCAALAGGLHESWNGGPATATGGATVFAALMSPLALAAAGGYRGRRRRQASRLLVVARLYYAAMALSWLTLVAAVAAGWAIDLSQTLAVSLVLPLGWLAARWVCDRHPGVAVERVVVLGDVDAAERFASLVRRQGRRDLQIVGRLGAEADDAVGGTVRRLGDVDDLHTVARGDHVDRVVVAMPPHMDHAITDQLREVLSDGTPVDIVPRLVDLYGPEPGGYSLAGTPVVHIEPHPASRAQRAAKRAMDVAGASLALTLGLPLILGVAALVAMVDGRPVLFRQERVGRDGKPFTMLKFRTMRPAPAAAPEGAAAPGPGRGTATIADTVTSLKNDDSRTTRLGRTLRATSLDEVPQFINVLRGDMSLVGPRPLRSFEVAALSSWQLARQNVRPGMTGLWQVVGRSDLEWDERIQLDYTYAAHWSLFYDLRVIARTLPAAISRSGAR